jgi:general secretion pathway protein D
MKINKAGPFYFAAIVLLYHPAQAFAGERRTYEIRAESLADFNYEPKKIRDSLDAALLKDPNSFSLNFLSGLVYDSQSTSGSEGRELARVGYVATLRSDPTYWPANFQLGLLALEDKDAVSAESFFIAAAFYAPNQPQVFYALARAAYCAGDMANAATALKRAMDLSSPKETDELVTATLVAAATGDQANAQKWFDALSAGAKQGPDSYLQSRMLDLLATASGSTASLVAAPAAVQPTTPPQATAGRRKMATVDVVIIRRKEAKVSSSGVNLMDALSLQFGSTLINSERSRVFNRQDSSVISDAVTTINNLNLTVPAVTYSLNIANAGGSNSSIQARPTILVYDGETSKLFSGGTITYAASGQLSSQSFTKEVGLSLSVTPKFRTEDIITLKISAGLETFDASAAASTFREALQTEKSSTELTADLRYGDTVVISSANFSELQTSNSGVPVLGDLPILGNLFKKRFNAFDSNDLLILLSVRREVGGAETGSAAEIQNVSLMAGRLWKKLAIAQPEAMSKRDPEAHRQYYTLENAGRGFSKAYINAVGMSDFVIR